MKKSVNLQEINKKLDKLLKRQQKIMAAEKEQIERGKKRTEKIKEVEGKELEQLAKLEQFEQEIKKAVGRHPLTKITLRDIAKGTIGAFFGIAAHYTFVYGVKVAQQIDMIRATIIFILAYLVGAVFLYITGYRKLKIKTFAFLPVRLTVLYITAIVTSFLLLNLFEPTFLSTFENAYKSLATVSLSATIGACTADLIGRGE